MRGFWLGLRHIWEAWKDIAHQIGTFQARLLLTILYFVLVLPFGLVVRWFSDPLRIKKRPAQWLDYTDAVSDLRWAKRQ